MNEFMLLFRNVSGNGQYITTPQDMQADMPHWQRWMGDIARQGKLVSSKPIDYAGVVVTNDAVAEGGSLMYAGAFARDKRLSFSVPASNPA